MKKKINKIIKTKRTRIKSKIFQIAAIVLMIDQFTKILVTANLAEEKAYEIIKHFFSLYYVKNTGAAFSILQNQSFILILLSLIILIVLNNYITVLEKSSKLETISLGLILGGIIGNLIDRLLYNSVIDFLSFNLFGYSFPVFNIADCAIVIGVILFVVASIMDNFSEKEAKTIDVEAEIKKIEDTTKKKTKTTKKKQTKNKSASKKKSTSKKKNR